MKPKDFDCVEMKREIQERIMKEFEGLSPEERRRLSEERISSDPILGPFLRRIRRIPTGSNPQKREE